MRAVTKHCILVALNGRFKSEWHALKKINLLKMQSKELTTCKYLEHGTGGTGELKDISANSNAGHAG